MISKHNITGFNEEEQTQIRALNEIVVKIMEATNNKYPLRKNHILLVHELLPSITDKVMDFYIEFASKNLRGNPEFPPSFDMAKRINDIIFGAVKSNSFITFNPGFSYFGDQNK